MLPEIKIFISSPGDVQQERDVAKQVIRKLQSEHHGRLILTPILWEDTFYKAQDTFQRQIPLPSETDLVVCILWKRLGSDLPPEYDRPDGTPRTGTEWEFEDALQKALGHEVPDILVYRKQLFEADEQESAEAAEDFLRVKHFWKRWFHNEQGHFTAGFQFFDETGEFEAAFERHLRQWIARRQGDIVWPIDKKGSPYPGLASFDMDRTEVFFGRSRALKELRARLISSALRECGFVLVTGMSGSGKSSLVRAGLAPNLMAHGSVPGVDHWMHAYVRPGNVAREPLAALAGAIEAALPGMVETDSGSAPLARAWRDSPDRAGQDVAAGLQRIAKNIADQENRTRPPTVRLLLVVDQLEELLQAPSKARTAFGETLRALAKDGNVWVAATLRSDFHKAIMSVESIAKLCDEGGQYPLSLPNPTEIREIVQGPAQAADILFETHPETGESLAERLERSSSGPGSLPMLQFAMGRLFENRDKTKNKFLWETYEAMGGLEGALSSHADAIHARLNPKQQAVLPSALLKLVTIRQDNPGAYVTRIADMAEFSGTEQEVAKLLAGPDARLLALDGDISQEGTVKVRVAHEALFSHWERAKKILDDAAPALRARSRLGQAAGYWQAQDMRPEMLMTSLPVLLETRTLLDRHGVVLNPLESEFFHASLKRASRNVRLKRMAVAALAVLTVLAVGAGLWANTMRMKAEQETLRADKELSNVFLDRGKIARSEGDWPMALRNYQAALAAFDSPESRINLSTAMSGFVPELAVLRGHERPVRAVAFSPDGSTLATSGGRVLLWDLATGMMLAPLPGGTGVQSPTFSPDGSILAGIAPSGRLSMWDMDTRVPLDVPALLVPDVTCLAFGPRGKVLATGHADGTIRLSELRGDRTLSIREQGPPVHALAFGSRGRVLLAGGDKGAITALDPMTGDELYRLPGPCSSTVSTLSVSPLTGVELVTALYSDGTARFWGMKGTRLPQPEEGFILRREYEVRALAYHPANQVLAVDEGGDVRLHTAFRFNAENKLLAPDTPIEAPFALLRGDDADAVFRCLAFSPDGNLLATGGDDGSVRLWRTGSGGAPIDTQRLFKELFPDADMSGAIVRRWEKNGERIPRHTSGRFVRPAVAPDSPGGSLASGVFYEKTLLWDTRTGDVLSILEDREADILAHAAAAGDGIAEVGVDGSIKFKHRATSEEFPPPDWYLGGVGKSAFSPDGRFAAFAYGHGGDIRVWEVGKGKEPVVINGRGGLPETLLFRPGGPTLATAAADGTVRLFDVLTGEPVGLHKLESDQAEIAFSPDGQILAVWDPRYDGIHLFDSDNGDKLALLSGISFQQYGLAFSPDGRTAAAASPVDVNVWDVRSGEHLTVLEGHAGGAKTAAFHPDGRTLASYGQDGSIRIFNSRSGELVGSLQPNQGVEMLAFSPDGATLAAAGFRDRIFKRVVFLDAVTGKTLGRTKAMLLSSIAFSGDGQALLSWGHRFLLTRLDLGLRYSADGLLDEADQVILLGMSIDIDVNGERTGRDPCDVLRDRHEAARAGAIPWLDHGGEDMASGFEKQLQLLQCPAGD